MLGSALAASFDHQGFALLEQEVVHGVLDLLQHRQVELGLYLLVLADREDSPDQRRENALVPEEASRHMASRAVEGVWEAG